MNDLKSVFDFIIELFQVVFSFLSSIEFWFPAFGQVTLLEIIFGGFIIAAVITLFYKGARS